MDQAIKDIVRENIRLNQVSFDGVGGEFLETLIELTSRLEKCIKHINSPSSSLSTTRNSTLVMGLSKEKDTNNDSEANNTLNKERNQTTIDEKNHTMLPNVKKNIYKSKSTNKNKLENVKSIDITDWVLKKSSRTTSGYDSYIILDELMRTDLLVLKPRYEPPPPVDIQLKLIDGINGGADLEIMVSQVNLYGLFHMDDIDEFASKMGTELPSPWLSLDTEVIDKTNINTGTNIRFMRVKIPELMEKKMKEKTEKESENIAKGDEKQRTTSAENIIKETDKKGIKEPEKEG